MNDLKQIIGKEWERNLLVLVALGVAAVVGYYGYLFLHHEEEPLEAPKAKPQLPAYFAIHRLDGVPSSQFPAGINPMSCLFAKPEPPKPPPKPPWKKPDKPAPTAPATKPAPQPVKPAAQPPKPPVKQEPPKPKPPPKPPRVIELRYMGNMSIDGGSTAAQLYVSEILSKKQKNSFRARLQNGGKILGGLLTVKEFDKYRVILIHSGNKEVHVPSKQKKPTTISIPQ